MLTAPIKIHLLDVSDDSTDSRVSPHDGVLPIKHQIPIIDATVLIMNGFLILSFASANGFNFQRSKRSSKICDFDNPDVPMSTDVENSLGFLAYTEDYRYDYYYPTRHYSYNVTGWIENSWVREYPDNIEPVWKNRGACKKEEINPSTWISKTVFHETEYGAVYTYNELEDCGQGGEIRNIRQIKSKLGIYTFSTILSDTGLRKKRIILP